jgi:hypothetical protein
MNQACFSMPAEAGKIRQQMKASTITLLGLEWTPRQLRRELKRALGLLLFIFLVYLMVWILAGPGR